MPINNYNRIKRKPTIHETKAKLTAYNGSEISVIGQCIINTKKAGKNIPLMFIIVRPPSPPILGLKSCEKLNLINRIMKINAETDLSKEFSDCFGELGQLPETHHITVDPNIAPVVHAARKVPIALQEKLRNELFRMTELDVIEPVDTPSEWVSSLVVVEKPNGKLRICLDPKDLNQAIKRHHLQLPTADEIFSEMTGARHFTKLDASNGYWQIKVDEESSKLLTFNTPFGRYRFKRLPFGIHSASEVFQARVSEIIEGIKGAKNSQDDILIWGNTKEELNSRTVKVLQRIRNYGLKLTKSKCIFGATAIIFLGHKLSSEGISPDPSKISAIKEMPYPENKKDLQRFLGMVAYIAKFIPHLSNETTLLRELTNKDTIWDLTDNHENAYNLIKNIITKDTLLRFFDQNLDTKITCDASPNGLGATLEQKYENKWYPIAFSSRTLTASEQNYCQLEKETLSIVFSCKKYNQYIYGRKFIVENDHKPLKSIFNKSINKCPPRIQRFMLFLEKYDFRVDYIPGKDMIIAEALSRAQSRWAHNVVSTLHYGWIMVEWLWFAFQPNINVETTLFFKPYFNVDKPTLKQR
jgi:hypothetical protein